MVIMMLIIMIIINEADMMIMTMMMIGKCLFVDSSAINSSIILPSHVD